MAQYRQTGAERLAVRIHHDPADRIPHRHSRIRRPGKPLRRPSAAAVVVVTVLAVVLLVAFVAMSGRGFSPVEGSGRDSDDEDDSGSGLEFRQRSNWSVYSKELRFGHGSAGKVGRDSRYWDRDDRRRDSEYSEEDLQERHRDKKDRILESEKSGYGQIISEDNTDGRKYGLKSGGRLYNEGGRAELDSYKEEYETSLKDNGSPGEDNEVKEDNPDDEYDDDIDAQDEHEDAHGEDGTRILEEHDKNVVEKDGSSDTHEKNSGLTVGPSIPKRVRGHTSSETVKRSGSERKSGSKRKPKHNKISSSSCEIKFLNSTAQIVEPLQNKKFARFSLQYIDSEDRPSGSESWEPRFAGHQTLQEREESFYARDQKINCGFVNGPTGSPSTGFDIAEDDTKFMRSCHIAVSSCIFGNSDRLRIPFGKTITRMSRKNICFIMFIDEVTQQTLLSEGQKMDTMGFIGLWKIIVVKNLPYTDMRRVGKIPKFLAHRLFPYARYSIWLDSKLRLQSDPYLILEYFLWRRGYEYAISNHYDRHCVWEEVMQNKKLNKYNHTIIDQQFEFYQSDGLKRFDPSDPNKLLPSYVPEGSFIVRAHTPMSNLFSCLWFNEVDRFTPRDQLSFAYTFLKLRRMNPGRPFYLNMFKDCERRAIVKLFHHRTDEKRDSPTTESAR